MRFLLIFVVLCLLWPLQSHAQVEELFKAPEFRKMTTEERVYFEQRFADVSWTGSGFRDDTVMDQIPTSEIRARLQSVFGDPTVTLNELVGQPGFRPGMYIQFEYWFIVDDTYPLMILDVDGPFRRGLVYGGSSAYVDLMPEVKRELSRLLMGVPELGEFQDYFYEIDTDTWYLVEYRNGNFRHEEIENPY